MLITKHKTPVLALVALAVFGWTLSPIGIQAETAGSYAHPDIGGPDEGNPIGGGLKSTAPAPEKEGSGSKPRASHEKKEGSASKGYGPGSHPHGKGYDKGQGHGKSYGHGSPHGKGHHAKEGSKKKHGHYGKRYGHEKKYGHQKGGSHGGHHKSGHGGHHASGGHKKNPFRHILEFRKKLGLTPDQVKSIMQMRFDWEKQRIKLGADLMIAHMELDRLVHSGVLDEPKMHEMAKLIGGLKMQKVQIMVEAKIALLKVLNDEQRRRIAEVHSNH